MDGNPIDHPVRGLALLSGGLDSMLAICVLRAQGIQVEAVVFSSPFFDILPARRAARQLDVPLHIVDFTTDILELISHPPHGFGGGMNPCIDCHAQMIRRAGRMMSELGYDFVATGEVINQRPMSQTRRSLEIVREDSGLAGRLLRPLSALLLEPTLPEQEGRVDRSRLLGLEGRSRKPQMALAVEYGLKEYPSPAGGCLLTEKGYCRKLADLRDHEGVGETGQLALLQIGRHFRLPGGTKCVAGRNRHDNQTLKNARRPGDWVVYTVNVPGPTLYLPGGLRSPDDLPRICGICAGYGDSGTRERIVVKLVTDAGAHECESAPLKPDDFRGWML